MTVVVYCRKVHIQLRLFGEGEDPAPLSVVELPQHPAEKGLFGYLVALLPLGLLHSLLQQNGPAGGNASYPHVAQVPAALCSHLQHPMAAHGNLRLFSEKPGKTLLGRIAQLSEQPAKQAV